MKKLILPKVTQIPISIMSAREITKNKPGLLILLTIVCIAAFFRFYNLSHVPPSASLDEVSIGYNAFSILNTGRDEYGAHFPLLLRAYDDWRPALYVYTAIPFIKFFGLSVLSVRLPSVILSVFSVFFVYLIVKELSGQYKNTEILSLLTTFLFAVSPWDVYISRLGHEVNLAFALFLLGLLFFLKNKYIFSAVFLSLSFVSYQTEKIFIPVFIACLFIIYKDKILSNKIHFFIAGIIFISISAPFLKETLKPDALIRFKATSAFDPSHYWQENQLRLFNLDKARRTGDTFGKLINSEKFFSAQIFFNSYTSHFNYRWLFFNDGLQPHKAPEVGLLYIWEAPFILLGFFNFFKINTDKKHKAIILTWFFSAPLAASITTDAPHALRSLVFLPTWQIFSSIGIMQIFIILGRRFRYLLIFFFSSIFLIGCINFSRQYFIYLPKLESSSFQYSLSKAVQFVWGINGKYKSVVFSNAVSSDINAMQQSYMFFLFYNKIDPSYYLSAGGTVQGGFQSTHKIGKYLFEPIPQKLSKGTLYVGTMKELYGKPVLKSFKELNGTDTIYIAEGNEK